MKNKFLMFLVAILVWGLNPSNGDAAVNCVLKTECSTANKERCDYYAPPNTYYPYGGGYLCKTFVDSYTGSSDVCSQNSDIMQTCTCSNTDRLFITGVGCMCKGGYYSPMAAHNAPCYACPNGGAFTATSPERSTKISDCYIVREQYVTNGVATERCAYDEDGGGYTDCVITKLVTCRPGYYQVNTSDLVCAAVGTNYYSVLPFDRSLCPPYTNPSGGTSYGQTGGSGTGADAIKDCKIPSSEVFSDSTGSWIYSGGCAYST